MSFFGIQLISMNIAGRKDKVLNDENADENDKNQWGSKANSSLRWKSACKKTKSHYCIDRKISLSLLGTSVKR